MSAIQIHDIAVSDQHRAEYRERGYWRTPKLLSDEAIAFLRGEFDRIFRKDYDRDLYPFDRVYEYDLASPELRKVNNGWWLNDAIREVVTSARLGKMIAELTGQQGIRVWHDQVVVKPGVGPDGKDFRAANIGWHQDYAHWQVASSREMCTLWIALQDTDVTNGGMRTIVGSHKWGLTRDAETFHEKNLDALKERFSRQGDWLDEPCVLKAGEGSVHHCFTFHGSGPNLTHDPRLSLIIHYMPNGTYYLGRIDPHRKILADRKGNRHANVPLLGPNAGPGTPFDGECFPQVWPAPGR